MKSWKRVEKIAHTFLPIFSHFMRSVHRILLFLTLVCRLCSFFLPSTTLSSHSMLHNIRTPLLVRIRRLHSSPTSLASVSATIWNDGPIVLKLYTKEGCTLCDVVKEGLKGAKEGGVKFTLKAVDITDEGKEDIYEKYKYDIPVISVDGGYWFKHRLPGHDWVEELRGKGVEFVKAPGVARSQKTVACLWENQVFFFNI